MTTLSTLVGTGPVIVFTKMITLSSNMFYSTEVFWDLLNDSEYVAAFTGIYSLNFIIKFFNDQHTKRIGGDFQIYRNNEFVAVVGSDGYPYHIPTIQYGLRHTITHVILQKNDTVKFRLYNAIPYVENYEFTVNIEIVRLK